MLKTVFIGKIKLTVTCRCVKVVCEEVTQPALSYRTIRRQSVFNIFLKFWNWLIKWQCLLLVIFKILENCKYYIKATRIQRFIYYYNWTAFNFPCDYNSIIINGMRTLWNIHTFIFCALVSSTASDENQTLVCIPEVIDWKFMNTI